MPPTDLDERLRRALAFPGEPTASSKAMGSVVSGLPRYRARRRAIGVTGASVLAVLGLTLGLVVVGLPGPSSTTTEAGPSSSCVQVQVGTGPASCAGRVASIVPSGAQSAGALNAPSFGSSSPYAPAAVPPQAAATRLHVAVGARVQVSLPDEPGARWSHVVLENVGPSNAVRSLKPHLDRTTGRTVVVVPHVAPGQFVLVATTPGSCASPGPACVPTAHVWSITLDVR
jgi:hypothetical protein